MQKSYWKDLCKTECVLLRLENYQIPNDPLQPDLARLLVKVKYEMRVAHLPWLKNKTKLI